jgi:addiction module RelE/StbE family toxin
MDIIFSKEFKKEYKRIKDKVTRDRLLKQFRKLMNIPEAGKPLKHELKHHRSVRIPPFRIIYRFEQDNLVILCFDHRKSVYKKQ